MGNQFTLRKYDSKETFFFDYEAIQNCTRHCHLVGKKEQSFYEHLLPHVWRDQYVKHKDGSFPLCLEAVEITKI